MHAIGIGNSGRIFKLTFPPSLARSGRKSSPEKKQV